MQRVFYYQDSIQSYYDHAAPFVVEKMQEEVVVSGFGATLKCASGRILTDLASGGFGYSHPTAIAAVEEQIKKAPLSSRILINRSLALLVQGLAEITPGDLSVSYICNSGEEALDSALKLVKGYNPKKNKIVVASHCNYGTLSHGTYFSGLGANYLTGLPFTPVAVPFGHTNLILQAIDDTTTAVLLPAINLEDGVSTATKEFWQAVRTRCDETKALLIVDERHTGLGFTGKNFAIAHYDVVPDVLVLGGALNGGLISIGAYVTKEAINSQVYDRRNPTLHGSTTGANPASCVAALAALDVMVEEQLANRHFDFEKILHTKLHQLQQSHPQTINQIRIVGSLAAIAFSDRHIASEIHQQLWQYNLLLRQPQSNWLVIRPPLTISTNEFQNAITVLSTVIAKSSSVTNKILVKVFVS